MIVVNTTAIHVLFFITNYTAVKSIIIKGGLEIYTLFDVSTFVTKK